MRPCARALAAALLSCSVASPQTEVKEALARADRVELAVGAGRAVLQRPRFSDVTVSMDGGRALVLAVVEADGRWDDGTEAVTMSYVGREAFEMERCAAARWCPVGPPLPALAGVLAALAVHRTAEERPVAWQIRIERDRATVGEDVVRLSAPARRRFDVVRDRSGRWKVAAGR